MSAFGSVRKDLQWTSRTLSPDVFSGNKVAVIGRTNGIGRALARALAMKGAEVWLVGRTFRDQGLPRDHFIQADLSAMKNARKLARELPAETLDMLIMTQGIFAGSKRSASTEGIERDDFNSELNYVWKTAHSNGVVVNEALVLDSAARYPTLNFYGMNPGIISSNIMAGILGEGTFSLKMQQTILGLLFQSAEEYADKILPLLVSPDIEQHSGAMFNRHGNPIHANPSLLQKPYLQRVVEETEKLAQRIKGSE